MVKRNVRLGSSSPKWKQQNRGIKVKSNTSGLHIGRYVVLPLVLAAGLFAGGKYVVDYAAALPVFTVRHVSVAGTQYLNREKVIASSGIKTGSGLFDVNLTGVSLKLSKEYAASNFTVFRRLPDTIVIKVKERKPVALIGTDKLIGIDEEGIPLPYVGADLVSTLPIITGIKSVASLSDPKVKARLKTGIKLLETISRDSPSILKRISEVNISTMGIGLIDNGLEIIIGDTDWGKKIPNLEKVITQVTGQLDSVKTVNMSFMRFGDNSDERIIINKK
ncbi:MAG: FtsQ-type POTRA domain-containing protein [Candidatus Latescibacterota bacterium]